MPENTKTQRDLDEEATFEVSAENGTVVVALTDGPAELDPGTARGLAQHIHQKAVEASEKTEQEDENV